MDTLEKADGNGDRNGAICNNQAGAIEALFGSAEDIDDDGAVGRGELLRLLVDQPRVEWQAFAAQWGARVQDEVMEEDKLTADDFTLFATNTQGPAGGATSGGGGGSRARLVAARLKQRWESFRVAVTSHGAKQVYAVLLTPLVLAYCSTLLVLETSRSVCTWVIATFCCCCSCGCAPPNSRPLSSLHDPTRVVGTVCRVVGDPLSRSLETWAVAEPSSPAPRGLPVRSATVTPLDSIKADPRPDRLLRAPVTGAHDEVNQLRGGRTFFGEIFGEFSLAWGGWVDTLSRQTKRAGSTVHMANVGVPVVSCHDAVSIEAIFDPTLTTRADEGSGRLGLGVRDVLSSYFHLGRRSRLATAPVAPLLPCNPVSRLSSLRSVCRRGNQNQKTAAEKEIEEMERAAREAEQSGLPAAVVRMLHKRAERARRKKLHDDAAAAEAAALAASDSAADAVSIPPPSHDAVREFYTALLPDVSPHISDDTRHTAACQMMAEVTNEWSKVQDPPQRPEWKQLLDPRVTGAPVSWPALHSIRKQHRTFTAPTKKISLGSRAFFIGGWSHTVHYRPWWQIWFWRHGMLHRSRLERGVAIAARSYVLSLYTGLTWDQLKAQPALQALVDSGTRRYGQTDSWWPGSEHTPVMPFVPRRWLDILLREDEMAEKLAEAVRNSPRWPEIAAAAALTGIAQTKAVELVVGAVSASHSTECFASPMLNAMLVLDRMMARDEMDSGERISRLRDEDKLVERRGQGALLDSFVWECARHNGKYVTAKVRRDMNLRDSTGRLYRVRRGTVLMASTALASRDPTHWQEPHKFLPARFVASLSAPELSQPSRGWKKSGAFTPAGKQKQRPERWARSAMTEPLPTLPLGCVLGNLRELDPQPGSDSEPSTPRKHSAHTFNGQGELEDRAAPADSAAQAQLHLQQRLQGGDDEDEDPAGATNEGADSDGGSSAGNLSETGAGADAEASLGGDKAEAETAGLVPARNSSPAFAMSAFMSAGQRWQLSRAQAPAEGGAEDTDNNAEQPETSSRSSSSHRSPMLHLQHPTLKWWVQRLLTIKSWHPDAEEATWRLGGSSWPSRVRWWQRARCPRFWQQRPSVLGDCCRGGAYHVEPIDSDEFDLHPSLLRTRDTVFPVTPRGHFRLQQFGAPEKLTAMVGEDLDGWAQKDGAAGSEDEAVKGD
eukprot:COSAG03_NODE_254_length_9907_cov_43.112765_3_plen_1173_part_00